MAGVFAGDLPCWGRVALGSGSSQVLGGVPECGWNTASAACPGPCLTVRLCPCALRMWAPPGRRATQGAEVPQGGCQGLGVARSECA